MVSKEEIKVGDNVWFIMGVNPCVGKIVEIHQQCIIVEWDAAEEKGVRSMMYYRNIYRSKNDAMKRLGKTNRKKSFMSFMFRKAGV